MSNHSEFECPIMPAFVTLNYDFTNMQWDDLHLYTKGTSDVVNDLCTQVNLHDKDACTGAEQVVRLAEAYWIGKKELEHHGELRENTIAYMRSLIHVDVATSELHLPWLISYVQDSRW